MARLREVRCIERFCYALPPAIRPLCEPKALPREMAREGFFTQGAGKSASSRSRGPAGNAFVVQLKPMGKKLVVIVGRPNVGKSTLFNRMTRTRAAIVEDIPGVTRDRNYGDVRWEEKIFTVVDTGGFYPDSPEDIFRQAKEQAMFAVEEGDIVVHLLDGKDGMTPPDVEISRLLRTSGKKVIWAVNKVDAATREDRVYDFYTLGAEEIMPLSAVTGYGFEEFMESLSALIPEYREEHGDLPKIAVVGRPNVGKSTLVNALTGKRRMIVSPEPGTTRDAIDSTCAYHGRKYLLIDTAGLRKKGRVEYSVERYSMLRAHRSIERCDVALVVLDARGGVTEQDQRIAGLVKEYEKGLVFLLNKWDLVEDPEKAYGTLTEELKRKMWFCPFAPVITVSGLEKKRITKVFPVIDHIIEERRKRIQTSELNKFFGSVAGRMGLPLYKGKTVKLYYMTQVDGEPPTFIVFANYRNAVKDANLRFLEKELRARFGFEGTPLRIFVKERRKMTAP